ncbi:hypothetical protein [Pseudomonas amygdali]|uniref:hypothetical protein n=1 Tax=Pseudomonas amygdali TaxID=47877 RepID=UPI001179C832|nr:hypothetical protein [Pseudomonas amygdali]
MARRTKPLAQYFRVMLIAACLADHLRVARTGYGLARWFEADQNLPKYSIDEKNWRRFLGGHKPHQQRLAKIFAAAPPARSLFDHSFWVAIDIGCTEPESVRILESFGWTRRRKDTGWFEAPSELSALDRMACLLAMLSCERAPYHHWDIGRRLCIEFVEICTDNLWSAFSDDLLLLIRIKMEKIAGALFGLNELEVCSAQRFWGVVKEDFFMNESIADERAWCAWRQAIYTLNWQDQFRLKKFINTRSKSVQSQCEEIDQRVYRKVRAKMYRTLNKSRNIVILSL